MKVIVFATTTWMNFYCCIYEPPYHGWTPEHPPCVNSPRERGRAHAARLWILLNPLVFEGRWRPEEQQRVQSSPKHVNNFTRQSTHQHLKIQVKTRSTMWPWRNKGLNLPQIQKNQIIKSGQMPRILFWRATVGHFCHAETEMCADGQHCVVSVPCAASFGLHPSVPHEFHTTGQPHPKTFRGLLLLLLIL